MTLHRGAATAAQVTIEIETVGARKRRRKKIDSPLTDNRRIEGGPWHTEMSLVAIGPITKQHLTVRCSCAFFLFGSMFPPSLMPPSPLPRLPSAGLFLCSPYCLRGMVCPPFTLFSDSGSARERGIAPPSLQSALPTSQPTLSDKRAVLIGIIECK